MTTSRRTVSVHPGASRTRHVWEGPASDVGRLATVPGSRGMWPKKGIKNYPKRCPAPTAARLRQGRPLRPGIADLPRPRRDASPSWVALIAGGKDQGYVTPDDILCVLQELGQIVMPRDFQGLCDAIRKMGIAVRPQGS